MVKWQNLNTYKFVLHAFHVTFLCGCFFSKMFYLFEFLRPSYLLILSWDFKTIFKVKITFFVEFYSPSGFILQEIFPEPIH